MMIVKELMKELEKFNQDAVVFIFDEHGNQHEVLEPKWSTGAVGVSHKYRGVVLITQLSKREE